MQGRRLDDGFHFFDSKPGDYWRQLEGKRDDPKGPGEWHAKTPNGLMGSLANHEVVEHEDGTITVSPSILVEAPGRSHDQSYHGFLERGVWRGT